MYSMNFPQTRINTYSSTLTHKQLVSELSTNNEQQTLITKVSEKTKQSN
jgi:hypothetical protein